MNQDNEMDTFLRDGYTRYADVKDTLTTFETELQERLTRQFEEKLKLGWSNFKAQHGSRGRGKAIQAGVSEDSGRPSIWACHYDEEGYSIYLGMEWGTVDARRPVLYTEYWEAGRRTLYLSDPEPPVQLHGEGFLFVVVGDGFELEPMAARLLAETERALAKANRVKP